MTGEDQNWTANVVAKANIEGTNIGGIVITYGDRVEAHINTATLALCDNASTSLTKEMAKEALINANS